MKLVVGLGNPGEKYMRTRHNVGFMLLDRMADSWEKKFDAKIAKIENSLLVKPETFMNRSGKAVAQLANFYKVSVDDICVVHDDLDIRLGEYKIQKGIGPKQHNGVESVETELGDKDFWRVRIGVDNRKEGERESGEDYVLAEFSDEERRVVDDVISKAIVQLDDVV